MEDAFRQILVRETFEEIQVFVKLFHQLISEVLPKGKVFDSTTPHTLSPHFYFSFLTLTNIYLIRNRSHTCVPFEPRLEIKKQFDLTIKKLNTVSHSRQKVQQSRTTENNNNVNIFQECWNFIHLPNIWNLLSMPSFGLCYNHHY